MVACYVRGGVAAWPDDPNDGPQFVSDAGSVTQEKYDSVVSTCNAEVGLPKREPPTIEIQASAEQAELIPTQALAQVHAGDLVLDGTTGTPTIDTAGTTHIAITGTQCDERCVQEFPVDKESSPQVDVIVVPQRSGPVVPTSAISTDAAGRTYLTQSDGSNTKVTVLSSHGGMAVVQGAPIGATIRVFGDKPQ